MGTHLPFHRSVAWNCDESHYCHQISECKLFKLLWCFGSFC